MEFEFPLKIRARCLHANSVASNLLKNVYKQNVQAAGLMIHLRISILVLVKCVCARNLAFSVRHKSENMAVRRT